MASGLGGEVASNALSPYFSTDACGVVQTVWALGGPVGQSHWAVVGAKLPLSALARLEGVVDDCAVARQHAAGHDLVLRIQRETPAVRVPKLR